MAPWMKVDWRLPWAKDRGERAGMAHRAGISLGMVGTLWTCVVVGLHSFVNALLQKVEQYRTHHNSKISLAFLMCQTMKNTTQKSVVFSFILYSPNLCARGCLGNVFTPWTRNFLSPVLRSLIVF